jgi:hypothetical protein
MVVKSKEEPNNGHWVYPEIVNIDEWFGFIYRIIDKKNNREYIGKKQFKERTSKKLVTRKNKIWTEKESNWKRYTSSSTELNEVIKNDPRENFIFIIESLRNTKGSLTYAEVECMIDNDVLRARNPDGSRKFYNKIIPPIKFLPPLLTEDEDSHRIYNKIKDIYPDMNFCWEHGMCEEDRVEFRERYRLGENHSFKRKKTHEEYEKWLDENWRGSNNPMHGRTGELSVRYGKSPYENMSEEQIDELKQHLSVIRKGKKTGISCFKNFTEEQLDNHKKNLSVKMSGENNPMYGKQSMADKSSEEIASWKQKISDTTKGRPKSEETKTKMRHTRGKQEEAICPECNFSGGSSNMKRYHFENCSVKEIRTNIENSGIDFTKRGWVSALSPLIGKSPSEVKKYLEQSMPDFLKSCFPN